MRRFFLSILAVGLAGVLLGQSGCRPAAEPEELGTVVFEIPKVPGSDEPYPLPQLDTPADKTPAPPDSVQPVPAKTPAGEPVEAASPKPLPVRPQP